MDRKPLLLVSAWLVFATGLIGLGFYNRTAFQWTFDNNLARYPLAASIAAQDPDLRELFLRRTEAAFNKGGWRAANGALKASLAAEVEIYADDAHLNAVLRARLAVLLKLAADPPACKAYVLAGAEANEFPRARQEFAALERANRAAIENGFDRKMRGENRTSPSDAEIADIYDSLGSGPVDALTPAELAAEARDLDSDAELRCRARIKREKNLAALDDRDAARIERILLTTLAGVDIAGALSKLCREQGNGLVCS